MNEGCASCDYWLAAQRIEQRIQGELESTIQKAQLITAGLLPKNDGTWEHYKKVSSTKERLHDELEMNRLLCSGNPCRGANVALDAYFQSHYL